LQFRINKSPKTRFKATYLNIPYQCDIPFIESDFRPVDVFIGDQGISILGHFPLLNNSLSRDPPNNLKEAIESLPPSVQQICGTINYRPDLGKKLFHSINLCNNSILACSDASLKENHAVHAWIISSGDINDITDPMLHISGAGPVDDCFQYLSLARAELTGLTALAIILKVFGEFYSSTAKVSLLCNNQGMLKKCEQIPTHRLSFVGRKMWIYYCLTVMLPNIFQLTIPGLRVMWIKNPGNLLSIYGINVSPEMKSTTFGWIEWQIKSG